MHLYDETQIEAAPWPDTEEGRQARTFLVPLFQQGPQAFFEDKASMRLLAMDDLLIPLSVTESPHDNSYFFSMFARYITSQRAAIKTGNWSPVAGFVASSALWSVGSLLKAAQLDKCVQVDNWPTMRNMGAALDTDQVKRLTEFLVSRYPHHAIVFPALNPATHSPLLNHLKGHGYEFAYMTHTRMLLPFGLELSRRARENRRRDGRIVETTDYKLVEGKDVPDCAPRLAELYRMLNREKYTTNPPITTAFFEAALRSEKYRIRLLVKDGRVDMFYGITIKDDVVNCALSGYDITLPQELGLYRMLNNLLMMEALDRGLAIETGGGADQFKTLRGDRPLPRYNAVYLKHLSARRRGGWKLVQRLANESLLNVSRARLKQVDGDENVAGFDRIPETFAPPFLSPRESVLLLRQELDALEKSLDEAATLEGLERVHRLSELSKRLEDEQLPRDRVAALRERCESLASAMQKDKRARKASGRAQRAEQARQLLEQASKLGDTTLVAKHLGEAPLHHLRTLAELLRKSAPNAAVVLAATQGSTVGLVTAATADLIERGVNAGILLAQAAPSVGGTGEGSPELAWAEGPRPEGIAAALDATQAFLQARLNPPA
ncbi:hypothetical protein DRW03_11910 [Corallococcus sp. H22C18031201]|nr:hypothetical protein DRW03_11910 [Corallococcus sp. H22C18031201]